MKSYFIVLSFIFLVYDVSADWKEDLLKQYISSMATQINDRKEPIERMQKRRGVGLECITTLNRQFVRLLSSYPIKIQRCMNGDGDQNAAKRCCEQEQSYNFERAQNILHEARDCILDIIEMGSTTP